MDLPPAIPADCAGVLLCRACGRTVGCTRPELLGYAQARWPTCCGGVMSLYLPADDARPQPPPVGDDPAAASRPVE